MKPKAKVGKVVVKVKTKHCVKIKMIRRVKFLESPMQNLRIYQAEAHHQPKILKFQESLYHSLLIQSFRPYLLHSRRKALLSSFETSKVFLKFQYGTNP